MKIGHVKAFLRRHNFNTRNGIEETVDQKNREEIYNVGKSMRKEDDRKHDFYMKGYRSFNSI